MRTAVAISLAFLINFTHSSPVTNSPSSPLPVKEEKLPPQNSIEKGHDSQQEKRSDEVIFFEKGNSLLGVHKRSEKFAAVDKDDTGFSKNRVLQHNPSEHNGQMKVELDAADDDTEQQSEDYSNNFYDALDYLVDKILDHAYAEADNEKLLETTPGYMDYTEPINEVHTERAVDPQDELTQLLAKQVPKITLTMPPQSGQSNSVGRGHSAHNGGMKDLSVELSVVTGKPLEKYRIGELEHAETERHDAVSDTSISSDSFRSDSASNSDEDARDDADGFELEDVMEYLEYLRTIKGLEERLKQELQMDQKWKEPETDSAKTRSKRSLSELPNGPWPEELDGGVYFTKQEAAELKDLLLQLAKERVKSEELVKFLIENQAQEDDEDDDDGDESEYNYDYDDYSNDDDDNEDLYDSTEDDRIGHLARGLRAQQLNQQWTWPMMKRPY